MTYETMDAYGIKPDGTQQYLGKVPLSPKIKMKEIANQYFPDPEKDYWGDNSNCLGALEDFYSWLQKQQEGIAKEQAEKAQQTPNWPFPVPKTEDTHEGKIYDYD